MHWPWRISCGPAGSARPISRRKSCYGLRLLPTQRRNLKRRVLDLENTIRHSLKAFGIRLKGTGRTGFDAAVREPVAADARTSELMDTMLRHGRCCRSNTVGGMMWW